MKFVELSVKETRDTPGHIAYVNPAHVVKVEPVRRASKWTDESLITLLSVSAGMDAGGSWSDILHVLESPAEVVRLLEGRPSAEDEAKAAEAAAKDEGRRAEAISTIRSLFGWPYAELGSQEDASTQLLEDVAASQLAYDNGYEGWLNQQERRKDMGYSRQAREPWAFRG